jgi:hypothetical protein
MHNDSAGAKNLTRSGGKTFYVYTHARPDGGVFYVGKGVGDRARDFSQRSEHHKRVCNKIGRGNVLIAAHAVHDERHAYVIERQLILSMRKAGFPLVNGDNGGQTRTGVVIHPEHREKIRKALTGHPVSQETRAKISAAGKGRVATPAARARMSAKKLSESHKAALLAAITGRVVSEVSREKSRQKMLGRPVSEETREKLRLSHLGEKPSAETLEKRSIALRAAWARRKQTTGATA